MKHNHHFSQRWFRLLGIAAIALSLGACGQNGSGASASSSEPAAKEEAVSGIQSIKDRGVLRVAVFADKPPFGYVDAEGKNQGYDVVLAHRLAKDLLGDENKVEFVLTEAQNRVDVLKSNKVDITLANFTVTPERAEQVDFALPYMKTAIGLVSPKAQPINDVAGLKGKTLIVNKGTTAEIWFAKQQPDINRLSFDHNTEAFNALKDKRGAALAHDNTLLYAWVKENPSFAVSINQLGDNDLIAGAVKKGNTDLQAWLNEEIIKLTDEGFFNKAYAEAVAPFYGEGIDSKNIVLSPEELKAVK
ncbi:cysteine ABC transporter substrate-binding protein [Stenoxybacter acetivorans]|uniref:cysteine ABC transporter substrate-binding protein n=1 Tax=Stenoxybacter acetivorans TaxID=422441 RepID=UPI00055AA725|nr:cysteine ABC transporter substrate-binding protein [Stenoxybacter acetivorans]